MFHRMTPEQWNGGDRHQSQFAVQHVPARSSRACATRKFGRVVNISSINGQKGQMGQANYSAAKAGETRLHQGPGAGKREARASPSTSSAPGYINTEMVQAVPKDVLEKNILPQIPIGRLGEPEEIARCVVFLASDDAGLITGSTLSANGGQFVV